MSDLPFDPESLGTLYCAVFGVAGGFSERFITEHALESIEQQIGRDAPWVEFEDVTGASMRMRAASYIGTYISTAENRRAVTYLNEAMVMEQEKVEDAFRAEYGWRPRDE